MDNDSALPLARPSTAPLTMHGGHVSAQTSSSVLGSFHNRSASVAHAAGGPAIVDADPLREAVGRLVRAVENAGQHTDSHKATRHRERPIHDETTSASAAEGSRHRQQHNDEGLRGSATVANAHDRYRVERATDNDRERTGRGLCSTSEPQPAIDDVKEQVRLHNGILSSIREEVLNIGVMLRANMAQIADREQSRDDIVRNVSKALRSQQSGQWRQRQSSASTSSASGANRHDTQQLPRSSTLNEVDRNPRAGPMVGVRARMPVHRVAHRNQSQGPERAGGVVVDSTRTRAGMRRSVVQHTNPVTVVESSGDTSDGDDVQTPEVSTNSHGEGEGEGKGTVMDAGTNFVTRAPEVDATRHTSIGDASEDERSSSPALEIRDFMQYGSWNRED